jgi:thiol-disulfide isomerase/thioredoxin
MQKETGAKIDESTMMESDAKQVAFTSEAAAQAMVANGRVVYFFKASWCPTCQALQKELDSKIGELPAGTSVVIVDYDNSSALKTKYAVTYQHTLVQIDATGKEISKWQGGGVAEIVKNIK